MQTFKYFTREENIYTKTPQKTVYRITGILLLALAIGILLFSIPTKGSKILCGILAFFGIIILLRATATTRFDTEARTITVQSFFFLPPRVFFFEDFQHFLVNKQTYMGLFTANATATIVMKKNGKKRVLLLHQTMFVTKPLQRVVDETAHIMGIAS